MSRRWHVAVAICALGTATVGCGNDETAISATTTTANRTDAKFCEAMAQLIVLLAPEEQSPPDHTKATFEAAAGWFAQANRNAPEAISGDFAVYTTAYDEYAHYLSTVGYNLDAVFSTPEGQQLAIDTSHTMTPAIVRYVTDECGLSFGEPREPPTS